MNDYEKIIIGNTKNFGSEILSLLKDGYLVLCVYKEDDKIFCVESYGYDENKNKDVYFHNYVPAQYSTITETGDYFVDINYDSFDFVPVFIFKESMIREARKIKKQEKKIICEIYKTKSNEWRAESAWGLGSYFCNEWTNEFGWAQEEEEVKQVDDKDDKQEDMQDDKQVFEYNGLI